MRLFVTGGSGFVGAAAARRLIGDGHQVVCMSRSAAADQRIRETGAAPLRCDLDSVTAGLLEGVDAVVHSAAYVEDWGPRDAWYRVNVLGTRQLLEAARRAGVRRFVHIGTEAAIVRGQHVHDANESAPLALDSPYPYCATKARAEQEVLNANGDGFATLVLRPRFVWGPGDRTILPMLESMAKTGRFLWLDGGRAMTSTTHIDNLVQAIVLALQSDRAGEAYFVLDDGRRSMREILTALAATRGIELPDRSAPAWLAGGLAAVMEAVWRTLRLGGAPPLTRHAVVVMSRNCTLIDMKARRELGYRPVVSVEQGLAAMTGA